MDTSTAILLGYKNLSLGVNKTNKAIIGINLDGTAIMIKNHPIKIQYIDSSGIAYNRMQIVSNYTSNNIIGSAIVTEPNSNSWLGGAWNTNNLTTYGSLTISSGTTFTVRCPIKGNEGTILFDGTLASAGTNYLDLYGYPNAGDAGSNNRTKTGIRIYCGSGNNSADERYREISISSTGLLYIDNT